MNSRRLPWPLAVILLVSVLACSPQDPIIEVADDDPEMVAAIAKARESLPQFWQVFEKKGPGDSDFSLKVKITEGEDAEYFWLIDLKRAEGKTFGTINNVPGFVSTVKLGDRIEIPEGDIRDWLYMRDGKMVGNYTLRALFKAMPSSEVEGYKKILADP